ncbi:MAG: wax ester/triacylglycerol synthase family O-acyltransferase [Thermoanaerobaculia bacterium]|nr:wax ester/triacylglycerol synthase family O-acyltransferase [Thermoanaerobaculia bacterium]
MSTARPTRLRSAQAAFLYFEKPDARMHTGGVALVAGDVDQQAFRHTVAEKLARLDHFRSVVSPEPFHVSHPSWRPDRHFDLDAHFQVHEGATLADLDDLLAEASRLYSPPLDRSRPLWEAHLIRGLPGGDSAMVLKVHRALRPQIGASHLIETLCSGSSQEVAPVADGPPASEPLFDAFSQRFASATRFLLRSIEAGTALTSERTLTATQTLLATMPDLALPLRRLPFNGPTSGHLSVVAAALSFAEVREIRRAVGGSVRDVLLTLVAGATARYAADQGESVRRRTMRVAVPLRVRTGRDRPGSPAVTSVLPVSVPLDLEDPLRRLRAVRGATRLMAAARVPEWVEQTAYLGGILPPPVQASIGALATGGFPLFNLTLNYSAGPQIPMSLGDHRVELYVPFAPVGYGQGLGCAVYNYNQLLHVGLTADPRACPDPDHFRDLLLEEIDRLKRAAGIGDIPPIATRAALSGVLGEGAPTLG